MAITLRKIKNAPLSAVEYDKSLLYAGGYRDVSELLANTTETYSFWNAGDHFRAGGFLYEVLPQGFVIPSAGSVSSNQHLVTAGGLKIRPVSHLNVIHATAWGFVPDGQDRTENLMRAINYGRALGRSFVVDVVSTVEPYRIDKVVIQGHTHDITIRGVGGKAWIKKIDNWFAGGMNVTVAVRTPAAGTRAKVTFENIILDSNRWGTPEFVKQFTPAGMQQCHGFSVEGAWDGAEPAGYGHLVLKDCKVQNAAGDGIMIFNNATVEMYDTNLHNCFRGGVTFVGHNANLKARRCLNTDTYDLSTLAGYETQVTGFHTGINCELEALTGARHKYANRIRFDVDDWRMESGMILMDIIPHYRRDLPGSKGIPGDLSLAPTSNIRGLVIPPENLVSYHRIPGNIHYTEGEFHARMQVFGLDAIFDRCKFVGTGSKEHLFPAGASKVHFSEKAGTAWQYGCLNIGNWHYNSGGDQGWIGALSGAPVRMNDCMFIPTKEFLEEAKAAGKTTKALYINNEALAENGDLQGMNGTPNTEDRYYLKKTQAKANVELDRVQVLPVSQPWLAQTGNGSNYFGMFDIGVDIAGTAVRIRNSNFEVHKGVKIGDFQTLAGASIELTDNQWFCTGKRVQVDDLNRAVLFIEKDLLEWTEVNDTYHSSMRPWVDRKIVVVADPNGGTQTITDHLAFNDYVWRFVRRQYMRLPVRQIVPGTLVVTGGGFGKSTPFVLTDDGAGRVRSGTGYSWAVNYVDGYLHDPQVEEGATWTEEGGSVTVSCQFDSTMKGLPGDIAILASNPAIRWKCTSAPNASKPVWVEV